jgi:poly-gamma-glutamate synthesis protein (capsule biosynthesis protein)
MDCGNKSAKKSAEWWESQEDVLATGMASTEEKRNEHKIVEVNGITYTMLSYTYGTNGIPVTEDYVVNVFDEETVLEDINDVRDKVDVLIVSMHWGEEYNTGITNTQKEQAKFLGENGVDIILGNHSHCIEPWEWIDEDTVVFYSFGNLISSQMTAQTPIIRKVGTVGMLGSLEITKTVDTEKNTSEIKIDNIGAEILYTYRYYNNKKGKYDYLIIPFSKMESKYLNNYEEVYDEFSSILKTFDENITIAPLPEKTE